MTLRSYYDHYKLSLRRRVAAWLQRLARSNLSEQVIRLTLDKKYPIEIGRPERVALLLVGCGGTGSFAAHVLAQLAWNGQQKGQDIALYFIDPDRVEAKNLVRQNFCRAELGHPKAQSLAWRYGAAFGLTITPVIKPFAPDMLDAYRPRLDNNGAGLMVVIGAVDNTPARQSIAQACSRWRGRGPVKLWWLDAGNEAVAGQVVIGNSAAPRPLINVLGRCVEVPWPHLQYPSLVNRPANRPPTGLQPLDLSCADLSALNDQHAMINRMMAQWIGVYLHQLLAGELEMMNTFVDISRGAATSAFITGSASSQAARRTADVPPLTATGVEGDEEETAGVESCPICGQMTIVGQDVIQDWYGDTVMLDTVFCARCDWRVYRCGQCHRGTLEAVELEDDYIVEYISGDNHQDEPDPDVVALLCPECDWSLEAHRDQLRAIAG